MMLAKYAKPKGERRVAELCAPIIIYRIDARSATLRGRKTYAASSALRNTLKQRGGKPSVNYCKVNIGVRNFYRTHLKTIKVNKKRKSYCRTLPP